MQKPAKSRVFTILLITIFISSDTLAQNYKSEMESVMDYMGKKLTVPIATKGTSCVGGTVTGSVCDITTCSVTTANVTQSSVSQGSGSLTCNAGYSGSPTYTCNSGTFTPTGGSCSAISCPVSGVTGINNTTVNYTASNTTLNCNATGYNTADSISYTCTTGTLSYSGACDTCVSGYTWNGSACSNAPCYSSDNIITVAELNSCLAVFGGFSGVQYIEVAYGNTGVLDTVCTKFGYTGYNGPYGGDLCSSSAYMYPSHCGYTWNTSSACFNGCGNANYGGFYCY